MRSKTGCRTLIVGTILASCFAGWWATRPRLAQFEFLQGHSPFRTRSVRGLSSGLVEWWVQRDYVFPVSDDFYKNVRRDMAASRLRPSHYLVGPTREMIWETPSIQVTVTPGQPNPTDLARRREYYKVDPVPGFVTVSIVEEDTRHDYAIFTDQAIQWAGDGFRSEEP